MSEHPDMPATATVLFTDLVDSTRLRVELGEERADQLRRDHDGILRAAVEEHRGTVVKGGGDGVMAAFGSASDALSAAVAGQQALWRYSNSPDAIADLSVRMGLSVGDVSWEDGDCFGTPVVEAARLEAAAEGGQILCSDLVRALARGRGGHEFEDLGFLDLKGLPEPLAVCSPMWDVEPARVPLLLPLPVPLQLAADDPHFVGRSELTEHISELIGSDGLTLTWLAGEPGAGKTRLAAEVAAAAHARGGAVLFGRCDVDVRTPYRPFVEVMTQLLQLPTEDLRPLVADRGALLAALVPDLTRHIPVTEQVSGNREAGQWRLLEALRETFAALAERVPTVVVIDDVQWATGSTLQMLRHLARSAMPPPVSFVMTMRETEPDDEGLRDLLAELSGDARSVMLDVAGLDGEAVRDLAEAEGVSLDGEGLAALTDSTAGNALFVRTLLRSGANTPALIDARDLQGVVRRRLGGLPPEVVQCLQVAAVVGLEFDATVVSEASAIELGLVVESLEAARRAGVVEERGSRSYGFVHALVRDALDFELSSVPRALVHLEIAEALDRQRPRFSTSDRAHHWLGAVEVLVDVQPALAAIVEAADDAESQHDWGRSAELLQRAVPLAGGSGSSDGRRLRLRQGIAMRLSGVGVPETLALLSELSLDAWAHDDDDVAIKAVIQHSWTRTYTTNPGTQALRLTTMARERPASDERDRILLAAYDSINLARTGRLEEADNLWIETVKRARSHGDLDVTVRVLGYAHHTSLTPSSAAGRYHLLLESWDLAWESGDVAAAAESGISLAHVGLATGRIDEVADRLARTMAEQELRATPTVYFAAAVLEVPIMVARGDFLAAEERATALEAEASDLAAYSPAGIYGVHMFMIRREQGRLGALHPLMQQILASGESVWRAGVAAIAAAAGDAEQCERQLDHFLADGEIDLPPDVSRTCSILFLADAAVAARDVGAAAILHDALSPESGYAAIMFPACFGPIDTALGRLSRTLGLRDGSVAELEAAIAFSQGAGSPPWEARARVELAATLHHFDGSASQAEVHHHASSALNTAVELGIVDVAERARLLLEPAS